MIAAWMAYTPVATKNTGRCAALQAHIKRSVAPMESIIESSARTHVVATHTIVEVAKSHRITTAMLVDQPLGRRHLPCFESSCACNDSGSLMEPDSCGVCTWLQDRIASTIYAMRKFHNQIKVISYVCFVCLFLIQSSDEVLPSPDCVQRDQIMTYTRSRTRGGSVGADLMDIGCGKVCPSPPPPLPAWLLGDASTQFRNMTNVPTVQGGDLLKWKDAGVNRVLGLDISEVNTQIQGGMGPGVCCERAPS